MNDERSYPSLGPDPGMRWTDLGGGKYSGPKIYIHSGMADNEREAIQEEGYRIAVQSPNVHGQKVGCPNCGNRQHFYTNIVVKARCRVVNGEIEIDDGIGIVLEIIRLTHPDRISRILSTFAGISKSVGYIPSDPDELIPYWDTRYYRDRDPDGWTTLGRILTSLGETDGGAPIDKSKIDNWPLPEWPSAGWRQGCMCANCGYGVEEDVVNSYDHGPDGCGGCHVCSESQPTREEVLDRCSDCVVQGYQSYLEDWDNDEGGAYGEEGPLDFPDYIDMYYQEGSQCRQNECCMVAHVDFWSENPFMGRGLDLIMGKWAEAQDRDLKDESVTLEEAIDGH